MNFILAQWQEGKVLIVLLVEFDGATTEDQREEGDTCEAMKPFVHYAHLHRSDQGRNRCVLCDKNLCRTRDLEMFARSRRGTAEIIQGKRQ